VHSLRIKLFSPKYLTVYYLSIAGEEMPTTPDKMKLFGIPEQSIRSFLEDKQPALNTSTMRDTQENTKKARSLFKRKLAVYLKALTGKARAPPLYRPVSSLIKE
jgi:hypothetical protein